MSIWPEHENTQRLLQQARDGDSQAIGQLLDRHRESLRRMIAMHRILLALSLVTVLGAAAGSHGFY